jgi:hypothetical protein
VVDPYLRPTFPPTWWKRQEESCRQTVFKVLRSKYPKAFAFEGAGETADYTLLFEWTTPNCKIVVNYGDEPDIVLTGKVYHKDYSYATQAELDVIANDIGVRRPKTFHYETIKDLLSDVEAWKGVEGVCLYCKNGQEIVKVKSDWYRRFHSMKFSTSDKSLLETFVANGCPSYDDFFSTVAATTDFEVATEFRGTISKISDAYCEVQLILAGMERLCAPLRSLPRKEAAEHILQAYGNTSRSGFVFSVLDRKPLTSDNIMKLMYQVYFK